MKSKKQKEYITKEAIASMNENLRIKRQNKDRMNKILESLGYDKTLHYTRSEKKVFTRKVKAIMSPKKKPIELTISQYKEKFAKEKADKLARLESLPHIKDVEIYRPTTHKANTFIRDMSSKSKIIQEKLSEFLNSKQQDDSTDKKKFRYSVQRQSEDNPMKSTIFMTDYIYADDMNKAKEIIKEKAAQYKKTDNKFTGIILSELKEDNTESEKFLLPASSVAA